MHACNNGIPMYFLKWPYGLTPIEGSEILADRQDLFNDLKELFDNFAVRRRSFVQPLWGYFGAGKTHTLSHFKSLFERNRRLNFIYTRFPTEVRNFCELYRDGFVQSFNFEDFVKRTSILWNALTKETDEEEAFFWILNNIANKSYDFTQALYNMAKLWGLSPSEALRDPRFIMSRMWLQGGKIGVSGRRSIGVTKDVQNDLDAVSVLGNIIRFFTCEKTLQNSKPPPIVWILDDCHILFAGSQKEQTLIQRGLRRTIDECPANLLIMLSFAMSDPEKIKIGLVGDLKTVCSHSLVEVPPLTKENALKFITDLVTHEEFKKPNTSGRFYPYTKESIVNAISSLLDNGIDLLPRKIMKFFNDLTSKALEAKTKMISEKFVAKFRKEYDYEELDRF